MRTVRYKGVSAQRVSARGGLPRGVCLPGGCLPGGCLPDTPPANRMTNACENITFPQLRWTVKNSRFVINCACIKPRLGLSLVVLLYSKPRLGLSLVVLLYSKPRLGLSLAVFCVHQTQTGFISWSMQFHKNQVY